MGSDASELHLRKYGLPDAFRLEMVQDFTVGARR